MGAIKFANFQVNMSLDKKINSNLGRVKVMVCHTGKNLNYSKFSKESLEKALHSLEGIPLVGEWKENDEDFGGHGGKIEISDEGFKYVETTRPYGFIPFGELANIRFETIMDKDGINEKEWLIADAYIWYKKYPEVEKLFEGNNNQSMEISVENYAYDEDGYLDITEFSFNACCILANSVSPAMSGAKILGYSDFKAEFQVMLNEAMSELKEVIEMKYEENKPVETEEVETEEVVETTEDNTEEVKTEDEFENGDKTDDTEETVDNDESDEEKEEEFKTEESQEIEYQTLEMAYDILKEKFEELEVKFNEVVTERDSLQSKVTEYEKADKDLQLETLYAEFSELDEEELNGVKSKASEMTVEEVETVLFAMLGRKQKQFSLNKKTKQDVVKVSSDEKDTDEPYGGLGKKYLRK